MPESSGMKRDSPAPRRSARAARLGERVTDEASASPGDGPPRRQPEEDEDQHDAGDDQRPAQSRRGLDEGSIAAPRTTGR